MFITYALIKVTFGINIGFPNVLINITYLACTRSREVDNLDRISAVFNTIKHDRRLICYPPCPINIELFTGDHVIEFFGY